MPHSTMVREVNKSDPESISGTGSTPKVDQFFGLVGAIIIPNNRLIMVMSRQFLGCRNAVTDSTAMSTKFQ